jgi:regulator of sigma E protease
MIDFILAVLGFLAALTPIVFVHELGHFLVARACGVRVDVFSIGFGRELVGWNDRYGTRWKISALPLGGYVKFFGDASAASTQSDELAGMPAAERSQTLHGKPVWQRSLVVVAGPVANFIFAILVFALLFMMFGQANTPPVIGKVRDGGAAQEAGLRAGDRILTVDGAVIERFQDLRVRVALSADTPLALRILRDGAEILVQVVPRRVEVSRNVREGQLGIESGPFEYRQLGPAEALVEGGKTTVSVVTSTLTYLKRWVTGVETGDQLSGPVGIADMAGKVIRVGPAEFVSFIALVSVAIGFINLFPIPLLDGGHLMFYAVEAIRGRPLGERAQEIGFRIGLALVVLLFLFGTRNDLDRIGVFSFVAGLFS